MYCQAEEAAAAMRNFSETQINEAALCYTEGGRGEEAAAAAAAP